MNMPVAVYVCYGLYVVYTGSYVYNRMHGKSAQFFTARVLPTSSYGFKLFADICVAVTFAIMLVVMLWKTFFA